VIDLYYWPTPNGHKISATPTVDEQSHKILFGRTARTIEKT
jgi:hypothetical protein